MTKMTVDEALHIATIRSEYSTIEQCESLRVLAAEVRRLRIEPVIAGWAVYDDFEHAAMYNISQKDDAYDALRRWGCSMTALVAHPDAPNPIGKKLSPKQRVPPEIIERVEALKYKGIHKEVLLRSDVLQILMGE